MKKHLPKVLFLLVISFFVSATLLPREVTASEVNNVGIKIMQKEELGNFMASGSGMTLYSYTRDEENISHCIEGCAVNWPPFYVDPSAVVEGCESSDFATITRDDGKKQTTYKNMPLYHFINDKYPGDTLGQGIGDKWFIIKP
jgi:predicted lipoprotein with Yx(FWY)xxD motif